MKIELTKGYFALVSDQWYDFLNKWKWCYCNGYAVRYEHYRDADGKRKTKKIYMHNVIMGAAADGMTVDHIDGNRLNNLPENLRFATKSQQQHNRRKQKNNASDFIGVSWDKGHKKWRAKIKINGKNKHLGFFVDKVEAAKEYDKFAKDWE